MPTPMRYNKFLVAGGNPTLIVEGCTKSNRTRVANEGLREFDQVGFLDVRDHLPYLQMMGDELCINATIALASMLGSAGEMKTSGLDSVITYANGEFTALNFDMAWQKVDNLVLFSGIGFVFAQDNEEISEKMLSDYCAQYNLPAFGSVKLVGDAIKPLIYVAETRSLVEETACGSASIATCIMRDLQRMNVVQPTGQSIKVTLSSDNRVRISAKVNANY